MRIPPADVATAPPFKPADRSDERWHVCGTAHLSCRQSDQRQIMNRAGRRPWREPVPLPVRRLDFHRVHEDASAAVVRCVSSLHGAIQLDQVNDSRGRQMRQCAKPVCRFLRDRDRAQPSQRPGQVQAKSICGIKLMDADAVQPGQSANPAAQSLIQEGARRQGKRQRVRRHGVSTEMVLCRCLRHLFQVRKTDALAAVADGEHRRTRQHVGDRTGQPTRGSEHELHRVTLRQR